MGSVRHTRCTAFVDLTCEHVVIEESLGIEVQVGVGKKVIGELRESLFYRRIGSHVMTNRRGRELRLVISFILKY